MPVLTAAERLGRTIDGTYRVESILAHGGMAIVFCATHLWTGRRVALKLLKPDLVEPARNARLVQEARAAAAVSHPNVVQVLDMGLTEDGVSYLVMELLEGRTLKDELRARGALDPAQTLAILLPLLGAMAVAHDRGIVHRDLKPANIFLCADASGRLLPKVLDFGIAKVIEESGITRTGVVLGTPSYLSPEQAAGEPDVGPAADVWAFGVIAFECLSGQLPFTAARSDAVMQRIVNEDAPPLGPLVPGLGSAFAAAIDRALRRDRRARYPDARSFARALALTAQTDGIALPSDPDPLGLPEWSAWRSTGAGEWTSTGQLAATPHEPGRKRRRPRASLLLAALAALGVGFAAYAARELWSGDEHEASAAPELAPAGVAGPPHAQPAPAAPAASPTVEPTQSSATPAPSSASDPAAPATPVAPHSRRAARGADRAGKLDPRKPKAPLLPW
jgi:serine/threonine-protein kinase